MPFSTFTFRSETFEMRDSRIEYLFDLCIELCPGFVSNHKNSEELSWVLETVNEWKDELRMPPGCIRIEFDEWLTSTERCRIMVGFIGFVASYIKRYRPAGEAYMLKECGRVQKMILRSLEPENARIRKSP